MSSAAIAAALVAACVGSPSPSPVATVAPAPSPASEASPVSSPLPSTWPTITGWVPAGNLTSEYLEAALVALQAGRAIVIGHRIYRNPDAIDRTVLDTEVWDPTGGWQPSASLDLYRRTSALAGLADGRLLLLGGNDDGASYADAYILDHAAATWIETGSMAQDRTHPAATLLPDGRVLVVGGYHYAPELEGRVTGPALAAVVTGPSTGSGGALFDSGPGPLQGRALATAELFDPITGTWTATGPMRYARTGPAITTLTDGRVLVVGSSDDHVHIDDGAFRTTEIYDPANGKFELVGSLPRLERSAISGVDLPDGPPIPGILGSLQALPDGGAVLIGRQEYWDRAGEVIRSFRMTADGSTWREIAEPLAYVYGDERNLKVSTLMSMVASLPDGSVLVAGGDIPGAWSWDEVEALPSEVRRYDPIADRWFPMPAMPEGRLGALGARLSDASIMLAGGLVPAGSGDEAGPEWAVESYRFVVAE